MKATGHTQTLHVAVAVALVLALAQTAVAGTQAKGDRKPAELWKTYPLDPARVETPTLGGIQTETGSGERPRAGSHAPIASSAPPESHESRTILFAIIGATLVVGLAAAALAIVNRPAGTPSAGAGDVKETLAGYGYYVSVEESKSSRSPPSTTPPFRPSPTKKGSSMVNFRRGSDEQAGVVPERPAEAGEPEENEAVPSALEMSAFASFGDEVQTILDSAQEAAAKIRGRAEDEAEEIHNAAAAAAEAERAEAARLAETSRADAEAYAHETRTAAEEAAERRRSEVEAEAGRILDEAKQRRDAIDADLANGVEHAEEQTRQRIGTLQGEIQRQEERLESIAVV